MARSETVRTLDAQIHSLSLRTFPSIPQLFQIVPRLSIWQSTYYRIKIVYSHVANVTLSIIVQPSDGGDQTLGAKMKLTQRKVDRLPVA